MTGFDALCLMVAEGFGIGVAPEGVIRLYARALDIRQVALTDDWARRELRLVEHLQACATA